MPHVSHAPRNQSTRTTLPLRDRLPGTRYDDFQVELAKLLDKYDICVACQMPADMIASAIMTQLDEMIDVTPSHNHG